MLKNIILKTSFTLLVSLGLVLPAFADVSISGRVRAGLDQQGTSPKEGDSASTLDIRNDFRLNFNVSGEANGWEASATARIEGSPYDAGTPVLKNASVKVENDSVAVQVGRNWYLDASQAQTGAKGWGTTGVSDNAGRRFDGASVSTKGLPVTATFALGMDSQTKAGSVNAQTNYFGFAVTGVAGPVGYGVSTLSTSTKGDKNRNPTDPTADKNTKTESLSFVHVAFNGVENLSLGLTLQIQSDKTEMANATNDIKTSNNTTQLIAQYAAGAHVIGFTYQMASAKTDASGGDLKTDTATMGLSYNVPVGTAKFFANYGSAANSGEGFDLASNTTTKSTSSVNVGLQYDF